MKWDRSTRTTALACAAGSAVVAFAVLAGSTFGPSPAQAAFPGENGRLACEGQRGPALPSPNLSGLSRTEVFTINPDGTGEQVLTDNQVRDGDPSFSPDGANIAFESFRDDSSEAYRMGSDGSGPTRLTTNGAPEDRSTNWSPDGTKIAFHSTRDTLSRGGNVPPGGNPFEIYVMDADGSNQTRITNNLSQDSFPQWSPDGSRLTFTTNRDGGDFEIYTMNPDGTDQQRVTTSPGQDAHSTWSPDGRQLTFHSGRAGSLHIFRQNADGSGEATRVTLGEAFEIFPVWSPDGTRIAFDSNNNAERDFEVYHVNAVDGSDVQRVTNSPGFDGRCDWQTVNP
jgi:Tol biopolymer transport system component